MQLYRHLTANSIQLKDMPFLRELSMEAYLIENPDVLALDEDELSTVSILDVELSVPGGRRRRGTDGRIDLVALYGDTTMAIIELKIGELTRAHLEQLEDYFEQKQIVEELAPSDVRTEDLKYVGILVGASVEAELRKMVEDGHMIGDAVPVAALAIRRYRGEDNNIFVVTDTFFHNVSRQYDRTKYILRGKPYGKSRLVLETIKQFVEQQPAMTFAQLEKAFPKRLQGGRGCFSTLADAIALRDRTGHRRHFVKSEEVVELDDEQIAVCNQWGIGNIGRFIEAAHEHGFEIAPEST